MKFTLAIAVLLGYATPGFTGFDDVAPAEDGADTGVPTAMFHGFGDACLNPGDGQFDRLISKGTNAHAQCIEVGIPAFSSVVNNFEHIAEESCKKVAANKHFQGEFNVIGLSQGGLIARYIVESCDMPGKVRNMVTIGGPHMGVDKVPHCFSGMVCSLVNQVVDVFVYMGLIQDVIAPAGYFRNTKNFKAYQKGSVFLPSLNNESLDEDEEVGAKATRKDRFSALNGALLVMFTEDTMIHPKETAHFQSPSADGKTVLPLD